MYNPHTNSNIICYRKHTTQYHHILPVLPVSREDVVGDATHFIVKNKNDEDVKRSSQVDGETNSLADVAIIS